MKAGDLFRDKMETCPIIRGGCGFFKKDICFKFKEPKDINSIKYLKNGEHRSKCPYIHRRKKVDTPEQIDWIGDNI